MRTDAGEMRLGLLQALDEVKAVARTVVADADEGAWGQGWQFVDLAGSGLSVGVEPEDQSVVDREGTVSPRLQGADRGDNAEGQNNEHELPGHEQDSARWSDPRL
jgi:hypothetical protein